MRVKLDRRDGARSPARGRHSLFFCSLILMSVYCAIAIAPATGDATQVSGPRVATEEGRPAARACGYPAWSTGGDRAAVLARDDRGYSVLVFSRAGRRLAVHQEVRLPGGESPDIRPVLNARGTVLYYITHAEQSSIPEIKALSLVTGDVEEVEKGILPAPRPSGPGLAFAATEKGTAGVNVYLRDGAGGVERVTESYGVRGIYWSPDGEKLALIGKRWGSAPGGGPGQWLSAEQSVDVALFAGSEHRLERVRSERGESYLAAAWPDPRTAAVLVALSDASGSDQIYLEVLRYDAESGTVALGKVGAVPASYGDAQMSEDAGTAFLHKAPDSRDTYCLVHLATGSFSTLQFPGPVRARMDPDGQAVLGVSEGTGTVFLATRGDETGVWDIEAITILPAESGGQLPSGMRPE